MLFAVLFYPPPFFFFHIVCSVASVPRVRFDVIAIVNVKLVVCWHVMCSLLRHGLMFLSNLLPMPSEQPFHVILVPVYTTQNTNLNVIFVINQLNVQILVLYNKFIICFYMFQALCAHHQEVQIVLYSIWYHHTCRWQSSAQVESYLNLRTTATYRCDDTRCCVI